MENNKCVLSENEMLAILGGSDRSMDIGICTTADNDMAVQFANSCPSIQNVKERRNNPSHLLFKKVFDKLLCFIDIPNERTGKK